jgi:hypothetical protein
VKQTKEREKEEMIEGRKQKSDTKRSVCFKDNTNYFILSEDLHLDIYSCAEVKNAWSYTSTPP